MSMHYVPLGHIRAVCGRLRSKVDHTKAVADVTCSACKKTEEYMAQSMEVVLSGPPRVATPEEHGVLDYNSLRKAPTS